MLNGLIREGGVHIGANYCGCLCKDMITKEIRVCRETAEMPDIPVDRKNEPDHRHTPI